MEEFIKTDSLIYVQCVFRWQIGVCINGRLASGTQSLRAWGNSAYASKCWTHFIHNYMNFTENVN